MEQQHSLMDRLGAKWQEVKEKLEVGKEKYPKIFVAIKLGLWAGLVGFVGIILLVIAVWQGVFGTLPSYHELRDIRHHTASELYSEDKVLLGKYYIENRTQADFDEISPYVLDALVATEDARFFDHGGIDIRAWFRVFFKTILMSNRSSGGGSTLSQQLAKNLYPRQDNMLVSKIKEAFVARRLEKLYAKEELLNLYLNTVSFSDNIYGIKVAAQRFFSKNPSDLTIEEAALLVGTLKGPSYYHPVIHPERVKTRRNVVLAQMGKYEYIDETAVDSLQELEVKLSYQPESSTSGVATYFRQHLRKELEQILAKHPKSDGTAYNLYTDGLKIYTTIDSRLQNYAEQAVAEHMPKLQEEFNKDWAKGLPWKNIKALEKEVAKSKRYKQLIKRKLKQKEINKIFATKIKMKVFSWEGKEKMVEMSPIDSVKYYLTLLNTGLLSVDPSTGLVKAWVGGIDYSHFQYDHVKSSRQMGSTVKPVVYAAALEKGILPCEYFENKKVTYPDYENWSPGNADGKYGGVYSMEGALAKSVNTVTVDVAFRAGIDNVCMLLQDMGMDRKIPTVPAIALGAADASVMDVTRVYGTLFNRGRRPELFYLDRIETAEGRVIVSFDRPDNRNFEKVMSGTHADMVNRMMKSVVQQGTAKRVRYQYGMKGDVAGKTGTTQKQSDGWFVGGHPKMVTTVWVGAEHPEIHFRTLSRGQGSSTALPIWARYMRKIEKDKRYNKVSRAKFATLPDTVQAMMACPTYLDELPIWEEYFDEHEYFDEDDYLEEMEFNRELQAMDPEILEEILRKNPRRANEKLSDYSRRIKRKSEKLKRKRDRKKKRKAWFDDLFFGDKSQ